MNARQADRLMKYLLLVLLVAVIVVELAPLLWMLSTSLKPEGEIMSPTAQWIPAHITLENYAMMFKRFAIARWFVNSIVAAAASTVIVLLIDAMAAYAFARMRFFGRDVMFFLAVTMLLVPLQVTVVPLFLLFQKVNLLDSYPALILPTCGNVFGIFLLRQFFITIPRELEEAAFMDGCGHFGIFFKIVLPLSKPALTTLAIFTFMSSWNSFLWPLVATNTDAARTLPVGIAMFISGLGGTTEATQYGIAMAGSLLSVLPSLVVFLALQRFFVRGIAMSGIKG
ncbi:MAG TPA: carbohydrate ABC transporter permease [bacterium]|nr:carbohydrate ABC transporter permease [bacterium]